jgi:putative transcriptional regulator
MNQKELKRKNELIKNFGKHIATLRKQHDLTAEQLADKADMERSALARIENGGINPSLFVISKLADALGMSISELMKGFNIKK